MAPLPPLTPPSPESPGSRLPVRTRSTISEEIVDSPGSAEIILTKLRGMIARGQDAETVLGTVAVAAHALTGADGAAIAMPRGGHVVCVGRSGEIAPELGALLDLGSGISGECLRTGRIMRCDDASRDFHVDPEVCRQLNIQSIAVVPLRGRQGRVGVLETFSARSYAFSEEHMELLGRLAGLTEAAWAQAEVEKPGVSEPAVQGLQAPVAAEPAVVRSPAKESRHSQPSQRPMPPPLARPVRTEARGKSSRLDAGRVTLPRLGAAMATQFHGGLRKARGWRFGSIVALSTVLLVLLAVLGWKVWYKASLSNRSTGRAHGIVSNRTDDTAGAGLALDPGIEFPVSRPKPASTAPRAAPRTSSQAAKSPAAAQTLDTEIQQPILVEPAPDGGPASTASADAPEIPTASSSPSDLDGVLPASPTVPTLAAPVSQGISGGVLVHRVVPTYPLGARQMNVQGTVVLEATIDESGQIENVKVVSGSPLLTQAAMDAVRKWRYTPYLLNGKPIRKETLVNVTFIPQ